MRLNKIFWKSIDVREFVMKKYLAEFIGTFILVFLVLVQLLFWAVTQGGRKQDLVLLLLHLPLGYPLLQMVAYAIGHISGCHVNPAVSLAVLMSGKMSAKEFVGYVIAQVLGALAGVLSLPLSIQVL